jgi:peroxidase
MASNLLVLLVLVASSAFLKADGKLSPDYYSCKCPKASSIVEAEVRAAIDHEKRIGASLLRLHFHDCFVNVSIAFLASRLPLNNIFLLTLNMDASGL